MPNLVLLRWETQRFTWQAVGSTEAEAREALAAMWADWCKVSGADPDLITEWGEDISVYELTSGLTMRDWEPYRIGVQ